MGKLGEFLSSRLTRAPTKDGEVTAIPDQCCEDDFTELGALRTAAFWTSVNLIAGALSKCEFLTYANGEPQKTPEWFAWNVSPNINQSSGEFLRKWVSVLLYKNEALIITLNGQLLVADSYQRDPNTLYGDRFSNIQVDDFTVNRSFRRDEVLFIRANYRDMRRMTERMSMSYEDVIAAGKNGYKRSQYVKGVFKYEALPTAGPEKAIFDDLVGTKIKKWLTADGDAALPLGKGQEWKKDEAKTYANASSRDVRALYDDVFDFFARSLNIPPVLLKGQVAGISAAVDQFITFCIEPLVYVLEDEINRNGYGYRRMRSGDYMQIDTKNIKHLDMLDAAGLSDEQFPEPPGERTAAQREEEGQ